MDLFCKAYFHLDELQKDNFDCCFGFPVASIALVSFVACNVVAPESDIVVFPEFEIVAVPEFDTAVVAESDIVVAALNFADEQSSVVA